MSNDIEKTLEEAKQFLKDNFESGANCPCCGQFTKMYRRRFNANMAYGLINIYKVIKENGLNDYAYIHVPDEFTKRKINAANTEYSKLQYWGLIEQKPNEDDATKKTTGLWRLTTRGINAVLGEFRLERYVDIFNGTILNKSSEVIGIQEALGEKFDYSELMEGF